jgi:hypothetical protein
VNQKVISTCKSCFGKVQEWKLKKLTFQINANFTDKRLNILADQGIAQLTTNPLIFTVLFHPLFKQ